MLIPLAIASRCTEFSLQSTWRWEQALQDHDAVSMTQMSEQKKFSQVAGMKTGTARMWHTLGGNVSVRLVSVEVDVSSERRRQAGYGH